MLLPRFPPPLIFVPNSQSLSTYKLITTRRVVPVICMEEKKNRLGPWDSYARNVGRGFQASRLPVIIPRCPISCVPLIVTIRLVSDMSYTGERGGRGG